MTSLESLKLLQEKFLEGGPDHFIFTSYFSKVGKRWNLNWIADHENIPIKDCKIIRYLLWGDSMKLSKTLEEKCPKLLRNASFQEVSVALDFVIKNYKKIC